MKKPGFNKSLYNGHRFYTVLQFPQFLKIQAAEIDFILLKDHNSIAPYYKCKHNKLSGNE